MFIKHVIQSSTLLSAPPRFTVRGRRPEENLNYHGHPLLSKAEQARRWSLPFSGRVRDRAPRFQRQSCPRPAAPAFPQGPAEAVGNRAAPQGRGQQHPWAQRPRSPIPDPPPGSHRPTPPWRPPAVTSVTAGPARSTSRRCAGARRHAWLAREEPRPGTGRLHAAEREGGGVSPPPGAGSGRCGEARRGGCGRPPASPRGKRRCVPLSHGEALQDAEGRRCCRRRPRGREAAPEHVR